MREKKIIKALLILICISYSNSESNTGNSLTYPHFKNCDKEWGDDQLYITQLFPEKVYTFCKDEDGEATFIDGRIMTLLADGLKARSIPCGEFGTCNPGIINKILIKHRGDYTKILQLSNLQGELKKEKILKYLQENYILISSMKKSERKVDYFLITHFDGTKVTGINHRGEDLELNYNDLFYFIGGWKVNSKAEDASAFNSLEFLA